MLQFYINFLINYYDSMFYYLKYILLIFTKSKHTKKVLLMKHKSELLVAKGIDAYLFVFLCLHAPSTTLHFSIKKIKLFPFFFTIVSCYRLTNYEFVLSGIYSNCSG